MMRQTSIHLNDLNIQNKLNTILIFLRTHGTQCENNKNAKTRLYVMAKYCRRNSIKFIKSKNRFSSRAQNMRLILILLPSRFFSHILL